MASYKKIARPINKAKNLFVKWLKDNKAKNIREFEGEKDPYWDYYRTVSGFIGENLYMAEFHLCKGKLNIEYRNEENRYKKLSIDEFINLIESEQLRILVKHNSKI